MKGFDWDKGDKIGIIMMLTLQCFIVWLLFHIGEICEVK